MLEFFDRGSGWNVTGLRGTTSLYQLHRDSDEVAWVLAGGFRSPDPCHRSGAGWA